MYFSDDISKNTPLKYTFRGFSLGSFGRRSVVVVGGQERVLDPIELEPVDALTVQVLMDNVTDPRLSRAL